MYEAITNRFPLPIRKHILHSAAFLFCWPNLLWIFFFSDLSLSFFRFRVYIMLLLLSSNGTFHSLSSLVLLVLGAVVNIFIFSHNMLWIERNKPATDEIEYVVSNRQYVCLLAFYIMEWIIGLLFFFCSFLVFYVFAILPVCFLACCLRIKMLCSLDRESVLLKKNFVSVARLMNMDFVIEIWKEQKQLKEIIMITLFLIFYA